MIYEIAGIEEGENLNDVIVTVNYWHDYVSDKGDFDRPGRDPDFIEDQVIIGVPTDSKYPKRTPMGQYYGVDGSIVMDWFIDAEGELARVNPFDIADQIEWIDIDEESKNAPIIKPVDDRARKIAQERIRGRSLYTFSVRGSRGRSLSLRKIDSIAEQRRADIVGRLGAV